MPPFSRGSSGLGRVAALSLVVFCSGAGAQIRDGGIDPFNLGKGDWIYVLPSAINQFGGNVLSVTNLSSMMVYLKNEGMKYVIIKAGTGDTLYPSAVAPQFTSDVVAAGHAAGLWVFGYNRSYATNTAGEVAIADYVFNQGADGFVWDAEAEWESSRIGSQGPALATNQCSTVRSHWPTRFLAHSPFPYISFHSSFPYKEFGYYCDAVMPQDYWNEIGPPTVSSPTEMVSDMNTEWKNWQNTLTGKWTNSIKPIVAAAQGWSDPPNYITTAAQITEFCNALKTIAGPATKGGYKGVNYWRAELHSQEIFDGIRTNSIGTPLTNAPIVTNVTTSAIADTSVTIVWTTDQSSDSVIEYGLTTAYGTSVTNSTQLYYHTLGISGLSPNTTYHYRVRSKNGSNQTGVGADLVFTTLAAVVPDVIVESYLASGSQNSNPPYTDVGFVGPSTCKSTVGGMAATNVRYATGGSGTPSCAFKPTLSVAGGTYDIYLTHCATSASADIVANIGQSGCSGLPATTLLFRSASANTWANVGRITLNSGVSVPTITFTYASGTLSGSSRMYSDAVKFVYVPPPPSAPSIATQPQNQVLNQGNTLTLAVVASGTAPLSYQWRHAGTNLPGATSSAYTKNNVQPVDAGIYSVTVTNAVGPTNSSNASVTVNVPPAITVPPQSQTTNVGGNVSFSVSATGTSPLSYQWQFNGDDIPGATNSSYPRNNVQTNDAGAYSVTVSNAAAVVVSDDAILTVNVAPGISVQPQDQTVNQGSDATFSVTATGIDPLSYHWSFNGTNIAGVTASAYTLTNAQPADAGAYAVVVTNVAGSITSSNATLSINVGPSISSQPQSVTTNAGSDVSFSVIATGTEPLTYQWLFNGTNIDGATGTSYVRTNVQLLDAGEYSVVVSNMAGSVTSSNATLTISQAISVHIDTINMLAAGNAELQISGGPGNFAIEITPTLLDWTQQATLSATGAIFQYTDPETNLVTRFYRVRALP